MAARDKTKIQSDVTVFGATGFVGKHVARYVLAAVVTESTPFRLTLAGRNHGKLEERKTSLNTGTSVVDTFVADSSDIASLKEMAERTRVVVNCAGPYIKYGTNVVAACAETGTDYLDITGEITWAGQMRLTYGSVAKDSGARIISLCGFDSIPSDMSVFAAVEALREARDGKVEIESGRTWHSVLGMANGGTLHSALEFPLDPIHCVRETDGNGTSRFRNVPFLVDDPLVLSNPTLVRYNPAYSDFKNGLALVEWKNQLPSFDSEFGNGMSLPFFMAAINAKVVAASSAALNYGPKFSYSERFLPMGYRWTRTLGVLSTIPALFFQGFLYAIMFIFLIPVVGKKLADALLPPGSGVPDSFLDPCYADVYAEVTAATAVESSNDCLDRATCFMSFEGDPGNLVTAQCVGEAALSLIYNRDELPARSADGFGTPAELLGNVLLKRLEESKVRTVKVVTKVHMNSPKRETKVFMS